MSLDVGTDTCTQAATPEFAKLVANSKMARGRRPVQGNGMLYMLAMHAATKFMQLPRKPPVTAALIALQTLIHLRPGKLEDILPTINEVCLNPYFIVKDWDLKRLWLSAFYHVDEAHLVYNMVSLMWKGVQLEGAMGSQKFATMVAVLLGLSHGLVVASSTLLTMFTETSTPFYSECSVGFSSVLFALKVVLNWNSPSHTNVYGVLVPSRYAAWVELIIIQMFVPGTSFLGHLCGIFAGIIYMCSPIVLSGSLSLWSLMPRLMSVVSWPVRALGWPLWGPRSRIYGSGVVGSRRRDSHRIANPSRIQDEQSEPDVWRCQSCTYDNILAAEACDMCGTFRGRESAETSSASAPPWLVRRPRSLSPMSREELRQARLARFNR